jgi:hypothetical protein
MTEKKETKTPKAPKAKRERKSLAEMPDTRAEVADPANRDKLKLFAVKRNQWGLYHVAARNPKEARVLVNYGSGKPETQEVRIGRAKPVAGVTGEDAFKRGA